MTNHCIPGKIIIYSVIHSWSCSDYSPILSTDREIAVVMFLSLVIVKHFKAYQATVIFFSSPEPDSSEFLPSLGVCRPLTFPILIFYSRTAGPNWINLICDTPWMVFFQIVSSDLALLPRWLPWLLIFTRTTGWNEAKFGLNTLWMVPFQICFHWSTYPRWQLRLIRQLLIFQYYLELLKLY